MESYICTTVNRWSYIMLLLCWPLYGLELVPVEEKTIAWFIITTMLFYSGDTGTPWRWVGT